MIPAIENLATELRRSVASGSFAEAESIAAGYVHTVDECTVREALDLLEWARRVTLAARCHYAAQLAALPQPGAYAVPPRDHSWAIDG